MVIRSKKIFKKLFKQMGTGVIGILAVLLVVVCIKMPDYTDEVNRYKKDPKFTLYTSVPFKKEVDRQVEAIVDRAVTNTLDQSETRYEGELKYVMMARLDGIQSTKRIKILYSNIDKYKELPKQVYGMEEGLEQIYNQMKANYDYLGWSQNTYGRIENYNINMPFLEDYGQIAYLYVGLPEKFEKGETFYHIEQRLKREMWLKEKVPVGIYLLTAGAFLAFGYSVRKHLLTFLMVYAMVGSGSLWALLGPLQTTWMGQIYRLKVILIIFMVMGCVGTIIWMYRYGKSVGKIKTYIVEMAKEEGIPKKKLKMEEQALSDVAEALNQISKGLKLITEEAVKSEHTKAELITNVSHDLKTPLTGMINYIGLLKQIDFEQPTIKLHIVELEKRTQGLKRKIEEVIEASKAITNNMIASAQPLAIDELVSQIIGEYSEQLEEANLEFYVQKAKGMEIMADSIMLWRIIEILFDNIIKYAMPGTRVYLEVRDNQILFKNMSRLPIKQYPKMDGTYFMELNEEPLRFGMGLTIAQSLSELQEGELQIERDGDLFKVSLSFPRGGIRWI